MCAGGLPAHRKKPAWYTYRPLAVEPIWTSVYRNTVSTGVAAERETYSTHWTSLMASGFFYAGLQFPQRCSFCVCSSVPGKCLMPEIRSPYRVASGLAVFWFVVLLHSASALRDSATLIEAGEGSRDNAGKGSVSVSCPICRRVVGLFFWNRRRIGAQGQQTSGGRCVCVSSFGSSGLLIVTRVERGETTHWKSIQ
jgi:hypothetical protein